MFFFNKLIGPKSTINYMWWSGKL